MTDFLFADHGSVTILTPLTVAAWDWVADHLPGDALTFGRGMIEHGMRVSLGGDYTWANYMADLYRIALSASPKVTP